MKKLLLLSLFIFIACEEKNTEEKSLFIGMWKVTEMGTYQSASCSGDIDDTEWRGLKGKGLTITLEIYDDGTGKEIITGPNANTNTFTWYDVGETFCYSGDCFKYDMAPDNKSFSVNVEEDSYCINEDYEVTGDNSERECLDSSTGNEWFPPKCNKTKYKKEI